MLIFKYIYIQKNITNIEQFVKLYKKKFIHGVPKGIRTPVSAVKGRCPRPLDDRDVNIFKNGEPRWIRTNDPQLKRLLLYRLS